MSVLRTKLPLRSWLLVALLPVLGLLVVVYAVATYRGLTAIILEGFDRKLMAVGTVTAAFIDPADHARLVDPLPLAGLASDPADGRLWSADRRDGEFVRIDARSGVADHTGIRLAGPFTYTAAGREAGRLLVADGETGRVTEVSLRTGEVVPALELDPPLHALATDPARGRLYVVGRDFKRIDLATGRQTVLAELPLTPRALTYDPSLDVLWALDAQGDDLLELDSRTGTVRRRVALSFDPGDDSGQTHPRLPVELVAIAYDPASSRLLGTASSLLAIDTISGRVSARGFVPGFGREQGPVYRRYAPVMRSLQNRVGTKYLYTQLVRNRSVIVYGLDASLGEEHSPLLSIDQLPAESVEPVQQLLTDGTLYVSGIQHWDQWGLLKSAQIPIFDPETGRVIAMTGADIDITTIQFDTHQALVVTVGAGILLMLAAGLLSLAIARRLTGPLNVIRAGALRAAAGDYTQRVEISRPRELRELAERFSTSTATLHALVQSLNEAILTRQAARDRTALRHRLASLAGDEAGAMGWAWSETGPAGSVPRTASGAVRQGDAALAWLAAGPDDADERIARRAVLAATARSLLARHGPDAAALARSLAVEDDGRTAWFLLTAGGLEPLIHAAGVPWGQDTGPGGVLIVSAPPLPVGESGPAEGSAEDMLEAVRRAAPPAHFILVFKRP